MECQCCESKLVQTNCHFFSFTTQKSLYDNDNASAKHRLLEWEDFLDLFRSWVPGYEASERTFLGDPRMTQRIQFYLYRSYFVEIFSTPNHIINTESPLKATAINS